MKKRIILPAALVAAAAIMSSGCASGSTSASETSEISSSVQENTAASDMFTDRDMEIGYDEETSTEIALTGESASCSSNAVEISGSTITITDEGTYIITGSLNDGMIIVNADDTDKVQLVLKDAGINNSTSAAIYVLEADKVFITTASGSQNTLSNGGEYVAIDDNNIDSVIFSKSDLTLNGAGELTISAAAGHGVVSKDDLALTSGTYSITAASHGLSGKDSVRIASGTYNIVSGKDGIHAENSDDTSLGFVYISGGEFNITSEGDGISAESYMTIDGGEYTIETGGGAETVVNLAENNGGFGGGMGRGPGMPNERPNDMEKAEAPAGGGRGQRPPENGAVPGNMEWPETQPSDSSETSEEADVRPDIPASETAEQPRNQTDMAVETDASADTASMKGIKAGTDLTINNAQITINSADDSLHSNGNLTINGGSFEIASGDDGMHADSALTISDGNINISQSYEGLEGLSVDINGSYINLVSSDDGINAAGGNDSSGLGDRGGDIFAVTEGAYINISGGTIYIDASGDGIDSNGNIMVTGGETYICGPNSRGDSAVDYSGEASVSGGIFMATGSSGMAQNFSSSSTQGVIMVSADSGKAGDTITLFNSNGNELISFEAQKDYTSVIVSCPEITEGSTYTVKTGEISTEVTMNGLVYGSGMESGNIGGGRGGRP